jgi:hypothetical protein
MADHWHTIKDSTIISGAGWQKGRLVVVYQKNGRTTGVYAYTTKDQDLCCRLAMADSPGQFAHQYIRQLPYAKIG